MRPRTVRYRDREEAEGREPVSVFLPLADEGGRMRDLLQVVEAVEDFPAARIAPPSALAIRAALKESLLLRGCSYRSTW